MRYKLRLKYLRQDDGAPVGGSGTGQGAPASLGNIDQVSIELSNLVTRVDSAAASLQTAQSAYASATDRNVYSTEEGWRASFDEHIQPLATREAEAAQAAAAAGRRAREILDQVAGVDVPVLSEAEQATAAARAPFIREDCETLSYESLINRVRQAVLLSDRPAQYLYVRYGKPRLAPVLGTNAAGSPSDDEAALAARGELGKLLREIEGKLRPAKITELHKRAGDVLAKAHRLEHVATKRQRSGQRFGFMHPGDVPWTD